LLNNTERKTLNAEREMLLCHQAFFEETSRGCNSGVARISRASVLRCALSL
jgi:hypothetical protein